MLKYILVFSFLAAAGCATTPQQPGKFSEWNRTIAAKTLRATGTLELRESRHDPRWNSVGSVMLLGSGKSDEAGIQAFVAPGVFHFNDVKVVTGE